MAPLFSLIIPTHNRAQLLPRAIESVLEQSCEDWELIIIDDGSTDDTRQVVADFTDPRIQYIFQEHGERSKARNRGIVMAEGQYFCFLDDDDYLLPDHLANLEQAIQKHHFPRATFRVGMLLEREGKRQKTPNYINSSSPPALFFLKNMAGMHSLCFHRDLLTAHQFDPRWHHFQDTHLLIRILLDFPFYQLKTYTAVYVLSSQMGSQKVFARPDAAKRTENNVAAIRDLFQQGGERLLEVTGSDLEGQLVADKYIDHAYGALKAGRRSLAFHCFKKSIHWENRQRLWKAYSKFLLKWLQSYFGVF